MRSRLRAWLQAMLQGPLDTEPSLGTVSSSQKECDTACAPQILVFSVPHQTQVTKKDFGFVFDFDIFGFSGIRKIRISNIF